jgi:hypothetical protein
MPVVDVHTHAVPRFLIDEAADGGPYGVRVDGDDILHPDGERTVALGESAGSLFGREATPAAASG